MMQVLFPEGIRLDKLSVIENPEINIAEKRVDSVYRVGQGKKESIIHLEFQLRHKKTIPARTFKHNALLMECFKIPVISTVIYLEKVNYRSLPCTYQVEMGGLSNSFKYEIIRLWEYEEAIKEGKLRGLAPLLILFADKKETGILEQERKLIRDEKDPRKRANLYSLAITTASRYFEKDLLFNFFKEELKMLKEASIIEDWINEGREEGREKGREEGIQEGTEKGIIKGREEGIEKGLRESVRLLLGEKFGLTDQEAGQLLEGVKSVDRLRSILKKGLKTNELNELRDFIAKKKK
jgi:predicted transposase YdaD